MGIFGAAKRGFGLLKKSKKGVDPKKRLKTFKQASAKASREQTNKKFKRMVEDFKSASERAKKFSDKLLASPTPMTKIPKGKKFVGRINPPGIPDVKIKKAAGGPALKLLSKLKKRSKLKGIHGGKAMIGVGAGAAAAGIAARNQIKKFERDVEKAGGLDAYYDKMKKKQGTGPAGGPKKSIKPKKKEKRGTKGL